MAEITYRCDKDFDVEAWLRLYHASDWNRVWTARNAEVMLSHAFLIVTAWAEERLVGTLTVLSDGLNYATIDDVVVHPEHRRRGIGSALMRQALAQLTAIDPSVIKLHAIPGVEPFYERLGFVAQQGVTGMYWGGRNNSPKLL